MSIFRVQEKCKVLLNNYIEADNEEEALHKYRDWDIYSVWIDEIYETQEILDEVKEL